MAVGARYIVDTSALSRLRYPEIDAVLSPLALAGQVATCAIVEMEILFSARGHADLTQSRRTRSQAFRMVATTQADFERAMDVMEDLALRGRHRSVGVADLITAAVAERAGMTIIHYDSDFELVSEVTGQPTQWVVPRGTVP